MPCKITMIGGGSSSFVPPLLRRFILSDVVGDARLTLMDVNEDRLRTMEVLAGKLVEAEDSPLRVEATTDRREALRGADFVVAAISVGGMEAWAQDIEIPASYGVFTHVADSVGPGGVFRTLRNAPVLAAAAAEAAEVAAPDVRIFNYTNPAPVEALAMLSVPGVDVTSLCSCTQHAVNREWLGRKLGVAPELIELPVVVAGINHCASIQAVRLSDGRDGIALARANPELDEVERFCLDNFGVLPYCSGHWVEFFPQLLRLERPYDGRAQGLPMRYGFRIHDMDDERARIAELEELAAEWTRPGAGKVALADLPIGYEEEGIEVVEIIESIVANRNRTHVVNVENRGAIENLPDEAVVELQAQVNAHGIAPLYVGRLQETLAAHLRRYYDVQRAMTTAALSGSRADVLAALLLDPMTSAVLDLPQTEAMLDEMLAAQAAHLPQFGG